MYKIYANGKLLHDPRLSLDGLVVADPTVTMQINSHGSAEFTVPVSNPLYSSIQPLSTMISIWDDTGEMFRGRVLDVEKDFYNSLKVYCEGALAFLLDTVKEAHTFTGEPYKVFTRLVDQHNAVMPENKRFVVGEVSDVYYSTNISYIEEEAQTTWDIFNSHLIQAIGGFIRVRPVDGVLYIDYLADYAGNSTQEIRFGENLLDMDRGTSGENIFTRLIPYGKRMGTGKRVDITSVNSGLNYVINSELEEKYGVIYSTEIFDDAETSSDLFTAAKERIAQSGLSQTIEATALDLHLVDPSVERIELGQFFRLYSVPHDVSVLMLCSKIAYDLADPSKTKITLGQLSETITSKVASGSRSSSSSISSGGEGGDLAAIEIATEAKGIAEQAQEDASEAKTTAQSALSDAAIAKAGAQSASQTASYAVSVAETATSTAESAKQIAEDSKAIADGLDDKITAASDSATAAQTVASEAKSTAESAQTAAETAAQDAQSALTMALTAAARAETAEKNAKTALSTAENASQTAESAKTLADAATTAADAATTAAAAAQETAEAAKTEATEAKSTADAAKQTADAAKTTADGLQDAVTAASDAAREAHNKAELSFAAANGAQIEAQNAAAAASAAQTTAEEAKNTAESIKTTADAALTIADRADLRSQSSQSAAQTAQDAAEAAQEAANSKAPISHANSATTYGKGTSSLYGHVKLSDSVSSTLSSSSGGTAATPAAVKEVYDLLGGAKIITGTATIAFGNATKYVTVNFGHTFKNPPFVIAMQVFNTFPLAAMVSTVTTTSCQFSLASTGSSSGSREFRWLAVGV